MKKLFQIAAALTLAASNMLNVYTVEAEPDYNDTEYWEDKCTGQVASSDRAACDAYAEFVRNQKSNLQSRLDEIESQRTAIKADLETYAAQIAGYQTQIDELQDLINTKQAEIDAKQIEIDNKQKEIDSKQKEIDETEDEVDSLREKVKSRMSNSQSSMRFNKYTDILLGASSFEDLLRIINGISAIARYDQKTMEKLVELINKLNTQKQELLAVKAEMVEVKKQMQTVKDEMEVAKNELQIQQNDLQVKQDDLIVLQAQVEVVFEAAKEKEAEMRAASAQIAADISSITARMAALAAAGELETIPTVSDSSWYFPVPGSYRSAGTWAYSSGYEHLGYDFAAAVGTPIYAVGSGVVLSSANGCSTYGGLGNMCGYQFGGAYGGGNQVHYLVVVNGSLYGIAAYHMQLGSPIASGTLLAPGTQIGNVGSSGNSSGPHCHIEIIYLGDGSEFSNYAQTWNGDLAFGAGWQGSNRKCDAGYGAPCRIRPETVFGY
ncbi:MAG: peptidoglycan DD-metalloendopeptidase family protein [Erysipelotrichaceae bacterium]|nr:peptidoglycan DD-metalloendopeptidase family protein [Erysipelotrichaceae bacterium]